MSERVTFDPFKVYDSPITDSYEISCGQIPIDVCRDFERKLYRTTDLLRYEQQHSKDISTRMKHGDHRYTLKWARSGQQRPFGKGVYEFELFVEVIPHKGLGVLMTWAPDDALGEDIVDNVAKAIGKKYYIKGDPGSTWDSPFLELKEKVGPGRWKYIITEEFTD